MTEAEWLGCEDTHPMLGYLLRRNDAGTVAGEKMGYRTSDRKLRLFAVACCRRVWHLLADERGRDAVLVAERFADGEATGEELADARDAAWEAAADTMPGDVREALHAAACTTTGVGGSAAARSARRAPTNGLASLLRDVVGNPFRPAAFYAAHRTPAALSLARAAYEHRAEDGAIDPVRLAVLADCLEEAGCGEEVLRHLRGEERCACAAGDYPGHTWTGLMPALWEPCRHCGGSGWRRPAGPRYRGFWALDVVLGKE